MEECDSQGGASGVTDWLGSRGAKSDCRCSWQALQNRCLGKDVSSPIDGANVTLQNAWKLGYKLEKDQLSGL